MILRFITVLLLFGGVAPPITSVSGLSIAIDPGRLQLMKDALSWMTFRRDGKLATAEDVEQSLFHHLKNRYSNSKFYRTFVIAFQQGVLPKMTLNEGDACDPDKHVWKYRSPHNNSITWVAIRNFTFDSYYNRDDASLQFCDYRQGLVCIPKTSRCGCREGSSMSPVEPGPSIRRCLLNKDEYCALSDFDEGKGPHRFKAHLLTEMVFNPMKPEGCKPGLLCRVPKDPPHTPKCFDHNTDPSKWLIPRDYEYTFIISIGEACTVDLLTDLFDCRRDSQADVDLGSSPGWTCFSHGASRDRSNWRDVTDNRMGFCSFELGPWQLKKHYRVGGTILLDVGLWKSFFVMGFVHPRTVPLDHDELKAYYQRFMREVSDRLFDKNTGQLMLEKGNPCNVAKTEKLADIWKFYAGLEEDPPPGQAFVATATKKNLNDKLQELVDLVNTNDGKICKGYWSYTVDVNYNPPKKPVAIPPLKCVKGGSPTGNNDGVCEVLNDDSTRPFADRMQKLADYALNAYFLTKDDEKKYNQSILNQNLEAPCVPKSGTLKRSLDSLEDGSCPGDSVCLLNYGDDQGIYDKNCNLKAGVPQRYDCQVITGPGSTGKCEGKMLNREIAKQVKETGTLAELGKGQVCRHKWEKEIRDGLANGQEWDGNKHKILAELTRLNEQESGNFCDRRRLLECTAQNTCECVDKTAPRTTTVAGVQYESDYCYLAEGPCDGLQDLLDGLPLTQTEVNAIKAHYRPPDKDCSEGNTCVFVDPETKRCTTENTGKTGNDLKSRPKPTTAPGIVTLPPAKVYGGAEGIHGRAITGLVMLTFFID